jgi:NADH:ubiquinone oxidoreductase subunit F (NADH-binding)
MGTEKIVEILRDAQAGRGRAEAVEVVQDLSNAMMDTSICGLGQAAPNPILSVIRHFSQEVVAQLEGR